MNILLKAEADSFGDIVFIGTECLVECSKWALQDFFHLQELEDGGLVWLEVASRPGANRYKIVEIEEGKKDRHKFYRLRIGQKKEVFRVNDELQAFLLGVLRATGKPIYLGMYYENPPEEEHDE